MKVNLSTTATALMILCAASSGCMSSSDDHDDSTQAVQQAGPIDTGPCTLTVFTETAPQDVVNVTVDGFYTYQCFGYCQDTFNRGTELSLRVPFPTDRVNCIKFTGWTGGLCGSSSPPNGCNTVCVGDQTITANWGPLSGCNPG